MAIPNCENLCGTYYDDQLRTQDDFWTTTIRKYQSQIDCLEKEKDQFLHNLETLQFTMLPFMTFQMGKLQKTRPNLNIDVLLNDVTLHRPTERAEPKLPDLSHLNEFTMQGNDVVYMDIVKSLAAKANNLKSNVERLHQQEQEYLRIKDNVEDLIEPRGKDRHVFISGNMIMRLNSRLAKENVRLEKELETSRCKMLFLQGKIFESVKEIEKEQVIVNVLQSKLEDQKEKMIRDIDPALEQLNEEYAETNKEIKELNALYQQLKKELQELWSKGDKLTNQFRRKNNDIFEEKLFNRSS